MSSLTSPALVFASDKAILSTRKALAKVSAFATDFTADAVQPGSILKIPVYDGGTAEAFDADSANYSHATGTLKFAAVEFSHHVKATFEFTDKDFLEFNTSNVWQKSGDAAGRAISKAIVSAVSGLFVYTARKAEISSWSASKAGLAGLRAACAANGLDPADCVVMIQPEEFASVLASLDANVYGGSEAIRNGVIEGLYGFKAVIENSDLPKNNGEATTKAVGVICPADAVAIAGRVVPVGSPAVYQEVGTQTDEVTGLTLGVRRHADPDKGANFLTVECLFGAALTYAADGADKAPRFLQISKA